MNRQEEVSAGSTVHKLVYIDRCLFAECTDKGGCAYVVPVHDEVLYGPMIYVDQDMVPAYTDKDEPKCP
jgi:hypothetical protein